MTMNDMVERAYHGWKYHCPESARHRFCIEFRATSGHSVLGSHSLHTARGFMRCVQQMMVSQTEILLLVISGNAPNASVYACVRHLQANIKNEN